MEELKYQKDKVNKFIMELIGLSVNFSVGLPNSSLFVNNQVTGEKSQSFFSI